LLHEWLLEQAKALGIHGGSAFRAIAGFGRHGILHEEHFFELAANLTVEVEFVVDDDKAAALLDLLRRERVVSSTARSRRVRYDRGRSLTYTTQSVDSGER
jgi:PII-like signaling protein